MNSFSQAVALFAIQTYGLNLSVTSNNSDGTVPDEVKDALITLSKSNHGFKDLVALNTVTEALKTEREDYDSASQSSGPDSDSDIDEDLEVIADHIQDYDHGHGDRSHQQRDIHGDDYGVDHSVHQQRDVHVG